MNILNFNTFFLAYSYVDDAVLEKSTISFLKNLLEDITISVKDVNFKTEKERRNVIKKFEYDLKLYTEKNKCFFEKPLHPLIRDLQIEIKGLLYPSKVLIIDVILPIFRLLSLLDLKSWSLTHKEGAKLLNDSIVFLVKNLKPKWENKKIDSSMAKLYLSNMANFWNKSGLKTKTNIQELKSISLYLEALSSSEILDIFSDPKIYTHSFTYLAFDCISTEKNVDSAKGEFCFRLATEKSCLKIIKLLDKSGANKQHYFSYSYSFFVTYNFTLIHLAAAVGDKKILNYFLNNGFSADTKTHHGYHYLTPLSIASKKGFNDLVELLLEEGASPVDLYPRYPQLAVKYDIPFDVTSAQRKQIIKEAGSKSLSVCEYIKLATMNQLSADQGK